MALVDDKYSYFQSVVAAGGTLNDMEQAWYSLAATGTVVYNNVQVDGTFSSPGFTDVTTAGMQLYLNNNGLKLGDNASATSYLFDMEDTVCDHAMTRYSAGIGGPNSLYFKSKSATLGVNTIVANGDRLHSSQWYGANGTSWTIAAQMTVEVDGVPGASNDMPGRFVFSVTPDGSGSVSEAVRISNDKSVTFSGIQELGTGGPTISTGSGTPEGVVTAPVGSTFHRTDGGAGTSFYVKESGTGNTGWVGK